MTRRGVWRAGAAAAVMVVGAPMVASAATPVPYHDPKVAGHLAFCDAHHHQVTGGPLVDAPMASEIVSDYVPPAAYRGKGAGAYVLGYQPRQGIDPGEWSGEQLTAASSYSDPAHPSAEVVWGDVTLRQLSQDYPPKWNGLLQLRMYYTGLNVPEYKTTYAATDIEIANGRWTVVNPVAISCSSGTATSSARVLAPNTVNSPTPSRSHGPGSAPALASASPSADSTAAPSASSSASPLASAGSTSSGSGHRSWPLPALAAGIAIAAGAGLLARRRLNTA